MSIIYVLTRVTDFEDNCDSPVIGLYKTRNEAEAVARSCLGRDYIAYRGLYTIQNAVWNEKGCISLELELDGTSSIRYHIKPCKVVT